MWDMFAAWCGKIWPIFLVGGGVFGMYKGVKAWVDSRVKRFAAYGCPVKVEFGKYKEQNEKEHKGISKTLARVEGKVDVILKNNGGGGDE